MHGDFQRVGDSAAFGDNAMQGDFLQAGDSAAFGDSALRGDFLQAGDSIVEGDSDLVPVSCTEASPCADSAFCVCADAACEARVCSAAPCDVCVYSGPDGRCGAGGLILGSDPNEACSFSCDGNGACSERDFTSVVLAWDRLFDAEYGYEVLTRDGGSVPCKFTGRALEDVFDGRCSHPEGRSVALADVAGFRFWTTMDCWDLENPGCNIGTVEVIYRGEQSLHAHEQPRTDCPNLAEPSRAYRRDTVLPYLADPDIFNDDCRLLLTGTNLGEGTQIYGSSTAVHHSFDLVKTYQPSATDGGYDYCWIWGGNMAKLGGMYALLFSSHRVVKGQPCPGPHAIEPTGYVAFARDAQLEFGKPTEIWFPEGENAPHSSLAVNQQRAIRIDHSMYYDELQKRWWLSYVWFNWASSVHESNRGNWCSSCATDDPTVVVNNAWPSAEDSHVTEGTEYFRRGSEYFAVYSVNDWAHDYGMKVLQHTSMSNLRRDVVSPRVLYTAVTDPNDVTATYQIDAAGGPAALKVNGRTFLYYHALRHEGGHCADPEYHNDFCRRDTVVSRLEFDSRSAPYRLNGVELSWGSAGDPTTTTYSLDIQLNDGRWIGPCVHAGILHNQQSYRYTGACATYPGSDATPEQLLYPKGDIMTFRIVAATNGDWAHARFRDVAYNGFSDVVTFDW